MQVTDRFGPIPVTTTLNGSGNGTVQFQVNGKNVTITNLFVKVSTSVNQAVVKLYKGQVADSNQVGNTNSGSTGAIAFGRIDLTDGETLYVTWTGGDSGASAIATFTGNAIPFDQIQSPYIQWQDPIAAGDGSLIYPALKSPNYVTGVSGWQISRDGDAEFNNVTVRGIVDITGPDGSEVRIATSAGAFIDFYPPDLTTPGVSKVAGSIFATSSDTPSPVASITIESPSLVDAPLSSSPSFIQLLSSRLDGSAAPWLNMGSGSGGTRFTLDDRDIWGTTTSVSVQGNDTSVLSGSTASTTFTNTLSTSGIRGIAFITPPSGTVGIVGGCGGFNNTAAGFTLVDFEVRTGTTVGSGTVIRSSDENTASQFQSSTASQPGQHTVSGIVTGLTAAVSYNVTLTYRVLANAGTFNRRKIMVTPEL